MVVPALYRAQNEMCVRAHTHERTNTRALRTVHGVAAPLCCWAHKQELPLARRRVLRPCRNTEAAGSVNHARLTQCKCGIHFRFPWMHARTHKRVRPVKGGHFRSPPRAAMTSTEAVNAATCNARCLGRRQSVLCDRAECNQQRTTPH